MPDTTPEQAVIQADRDAAADLVSPNGRWPGFPSDFRSGRADVNALTQAFARHRLAHSKPASAGLREAVSAAEAFDMGYQFAFDVTRPQSREDSRAVGRLLWADLYAKLHDRFNAIIERDGFDSFKDADNGIAQCKRIFHEALSTPAQAEPVAWMYHHPGDLEHGWQRYSFERRIQSYEGMSCNEEDAGVIETPLYAHPPAPPQDREAVVEAMARAIDEGTWSIIDQWWPSRGTANYDDRVDDMRANSLARAQAALDAALPLLSEERGERS